MGSFTHHWFNLHPTFPFHFHDLSIFLATMIGSIEISKKSDAEWNERCIKFDKYQSKIMLLNMRLVIHHMDGIHARKF